MAAKPPAVQKKTISKEEWERKLAEVKLSKNDLNALVMNYLVIEGYKDAAEKFQHESGASPGLDLDTISERMKVRQAIQKGDIQGGIERVNDLDPSILDTNARLMFQLRQQQLIEMIRQGAIDAALKFAQEELALRGENNAELLEVLERTMALLAFDPAVLTGSAASSTAAGTTPVVPPAISTLLDLSQRHQLASALNAAILASQFRDKEPKLPTLLKMLVHSQQQLDEKVAYPKMNLQGQFDR